MMLDMATKLSPLIEKVNLLGNFHIVPEHRGQQVVFISINDIDFGNDKIPCDIMIDVHGFEKGLIRVFFTSILSEGVSGENEALFYNVVDVLNTYIFGKILRDYHDNSLDILYSTNERVEDLTPEKIEQNLFIHRNAIAKIVPDIEHLKKKFNLNPKTALTDLEMRAKMLEESLRHLAYNK